jgi:hypothetical protein
VTIFGLVLMIGLFAAPGGADLGGPPPVFVAIPPTIVGFLMIGIAMVYDWRTRGRPHSAYVYGAGAFARAAWRKTRRYP